MEKWEHKSLEWIHKLREENFEKTKNQPLLAVLIESNKRAVLMAEELNLDHVTKSIPGAKA